jgi:hypothetical protein
MTSANPHGRTSTRVAIPLFAALLGATGCDERPEWSRISGIDESVDFNAVWGASADDVWAVGEADGEPSVWHYDGLGWTEQQPPAVSDGINDVWGASHEVWLAGHGGVQRRTANGWQGWPEVDAIALWGSGPDEIFAAGTRRVWRFDGQEWAEEPEASELAEIDDLEMLGVWGSAADSLWVVGGRVVCECGETMALYRSAEAWSLVSLRTEMFAKAIWGTGPSHALAVGGAVFTDEGSGVFGYDGHDWSQVGSGESDFLLGIWGTSASDAFAVGVDGEILHFDGQAWAPMTSGTGASLRDVWGTPQGDVIYAVGANGTILRHER